MSSRAPLSSRGMLLLGAAAARDWLIDPRSTLRRLRLLRLVTVLTLAFFEPHNSRPQHVPTHLAARWLTRPVKHIAQLIDSESFATDFGLRVQESDLCTSFHNHREVTAVMYNPSTPNPVRFEIT